MAQPAYLNCKCLNCKAPLGPAEGALFSGVLVCTTCFALADRLYERSLQEITVLQTLIGESIRLALVQGQLQFGASPAGEVSKRDVLRLIVQLLDKRSQSA